MLSFLGNLYMMISYVSKKITHESKALQNIFKTILVPKGVLLLSALDYGSENTLDVFLFFKVIGQNPKIKDTFFSA